MAKLANVELRFHADFQYRNLVVVGTRQSSCLGSAAAACHCPVPSRPAPLWCAGARCGHSATCHRQSVSPTTPVGLCGLASRPASRCRHAAGQLRAAQRRGVLPTAIGKPPTPTSKKRNTEEASDGCALVLAILPIFESQHSWLSRSHLDIWTCMAVRYCDGPLDDWMC
jgi:hypothetical protein